ncbi:hypothetical protein QFW77_03155 [Luteimonas sp. RD2P54]|uniref:DUF1579 domain-containing protein n=1 Tax=Luteimonas endophytica TaxID=3042023 RepID=A0ABT6J616_9GAMM|nr:hypothetical protein [Luteimonas endophytica]MDH5821992.1 hypothetical protein [Luteimonas endophytica]
MDLNQVLNLMNDRFFATLAIALAPAAAAACPHDLTGTWKSDREASVAFAHGNAKLEPRTEAFLGALFGHMTLAFTDSEVHIAMPDVEVPVSGERTVFAGLEERKPYEILFCGEFAVVWSARRPFGTALTATTFNFVDDDIFWVYGGGTDPAAPDLHTREYFQRVR